MCCVSEHILGLSTFLLLTIWLSNSCSTILLPVRQREANILWDTVEFGMKMQVAIRIFNED